MKDLEKYVKRYSGWNRKGKAPKGIIKKFKKRIKERKKEEKKDEEDRTIPDEPDISNLPPLDADDQKQEASPDGSDPTVCVAIPKCGEESQAHGN